MKKSILILIALMLIFPISLAFSDGQKVQLTFLEVMTSPDRTAVLHGIIDAYQAMNPNVTINLISPPYEQADNKLTMMLNAKQPLDIVEVRDFTEKQFVQNKRLENLEPYLSSWEGTKALLPVTLSAARAVDGKAYFLPQFFYIKALFVRTDMLQKLGVKDMPKTIDELYAVCKQITDPSKNQFGFGFRGKNNAYKISDPLIISDVANVDPQNTYLTKDGKSVFDNPDFLAALKKYVDLFNTATPKDAINWGFNEQVNAFVSGITPFLVQDPDTVPLLDQQLGREKYSVIPLPLGKSGKVYLDYGSAGFGIPSYSKNKSEAWKFIAYISSASVNADFCKKYGTLPITSVAFNSDPYFNSGVYKAWATTMSDSKHYVFIKYPLASPKMPGWGQIQEQYMQSALLGSTSPEDAAQKWAAYWK
jgi:multiple sugar transport system substrate-binding protein